MAINLIELAKGLFTGDVIRQAGTALGEDESGIRKAIEAGIPAILAGLLSKAQSAPGSIGNLLEYVPAQASGGGDLSNLLGGVLSHGGTSLGDKSWLEKGLHLLQGLFGTQTGALSQMIANYSGIQRSASDTLLNAAAPAVLGLVSAQAASQGGDASGSGISSYLLSQKSVIESSLPAGFSLSMLPGLGGAATATATSSGGSNSYTNNTTSRKKGGGWIWLLLLLLVALALWYFLGQKGCNNKDTTPPVSDTAVIQQDTAMAVNTAPPARESVKVQLPDGTELDAYKGGIEDQLVTFLKTDYMALGADSLKKIWFDFDNLNFETGKAVITPESQAQINNLTAILKAFPKAKLKIGGYTDKTGDENTNLKLSGERAAAVQKALGDAGVGNQLEKAEGYGSRFARFPADAPESDRVKDRHVSVSVRG